MIACVVGHGSTMTTTNLRPVPVLVAGLMTVVGGFLDAYTFLTHGVFATAQTGNIVFLIVDTVQGKDGWVFIWPIVAFTATVALSKWIRELPNPRELIVTSFAIGTEVVVLLVLGFAPATAASILVTVPIAAVAGLQLGLFRSVGEITFASIATTGNLMRLAEAGYDWVVHRGRPAARSAQIASLIVGCFTFGVLIGAVFTSLFGTHAAWVAAAIQLSVLVCFLASARTGSRYGRSASPKT